ncbi:hypothetical protein QSU92_12410 [Microbacterium sp. ET2]|uniref:hypothetical protein n=1 Tax=Microbacterium albipurpureum TaxID=3050384 RepID=UPI00259CA2EA|nr:hypothetical protein [Microbacterium sp. ET2 (Ac-2212)]WJL94766.1 hypothetical protein QSU92_12410 [Microbacterium sp. ET2 (Ac-2212)]
MSVGVAVDDVAVPGTDAHRVDARELVPVSAGGSLESWSGLVETFRPVFRDDPSRGARTVALRLLGAAGAWTSPDAATVGAALMSGETCGVAVRGHLPAVFGRRASGLLSVLAGPVDARLVFARTRDDLGRESAVLLDGDAVTTTASRHATGLEGVPLRRAQVRGAQVRAEWNVDPIADAHARSIVAGMWLAAVDTALRMAVDYARGRRLYRGTVWDIPHARSLVARARTWLSVADTVIQAALADPGDDGLAAAVDLVPLQLDAAMRALSVLFGSTFYARVDPYADFETLVRDVGCLELLDPTGAGAARRRTPVSVPAMDASVVAEISAVAGPRVAAGLAAASDSSFGVTTRREFGVVSTARLVASGHDAGAVTAAERVAALTLLESFATGRRAAAPDESLEVIAADTVGRVDAGLTLTLDRAPLGAPD